MTTLAEVFDSLKYRIEVDEYGNRRYYNALGQLHRLDGPAIERSDGTKEWCQNGLRHRDAGPAVEYASGSKAWYQNGKRHRDAGPAVEHMDGTRMWLLYGRLHRTNGPAVEWPDGGKEWWIDGVQYTQQEYYLQLKALGFNT